MLQDVEEFRLQWTLFEVFDLIVGDTGLGGFLETARTLIGVGPVLLLAAEAHQVLDGDVAKVNEEDNLPEDHQRQRARKFARENLNAIHYCWEGKFREY